MQIVQCKKVNDCEETVFYYNVLCHFCTTEAAMNKVRYYLFNSSQEPDCICIIISPIY